MSLCIVGFSLINAEKKISRPEELRQRDGAIQIKKKKGRTVISSNRLDLGSEFFALNIAI